MGRDGKGDCRGWVLWRWMGVVLSVNIERMIEVILAVNIFHAGCTTRSCFAFI